MKTKLAAPGSVSSGTMRPEDLVNRFLNVLAQHGNAFVGGRRHTHSDAIQGLRKHRAVDDEAVAELLEDLFDAMNEIAPAGHYFGAHPGDGADFGFWPEEQENPRRQSYTDSSGQSLTHAQYVDKHGVAPDKTDRISKTVARRTRVIHLLVFAGIDGPGSITGETRLGMLENLQNSDFEFEDYTKQAVKKMKPGQSLYQNQYGEDVGIQYLVLNVPLGE